MLQRQCHVIGPPTANACPVPLLLCVCHETFDDLLKAGHGWNLLTRAEEGVLRIAFQARFASRLAHHGRQGQARASFAQQACMCLDKAVLLEEVQDHKHL